MKVKKKFFTGLDIYKNGQGSMQGKILNLFTVIDAREKETSQSALITSFSEMMLISGYAFQSYIKWEEIDNRTVRGILTESGFKVTGIFHFDQEGKFEYFETNDRYYDKGNGNFEKKKFIAQINSYQKIDSFYRPKEVSVSWLLKNAEYKYFKGTIDKIEYNVK